MRLTPHEVRIIRETTREVFGPDASVRLFRSRTDDQARGGDIDLLVESEAPIADRFHKELELGAKLQMRLGDQPIDILVIDPDVQLQPIHQQARRTGIAL